LNPTVLIILDGFGLRSQTKDNGIALAQKPYWDYLWATYPHTQIEASGPAVGLPKGIMGNSEVGHMNLGAGRIVYTGLSQIYQAIDDGSFFTNEALLSAMNAAKKNKSALHLMGLLSDGAVHSHQDHLYALLKLAKKSGVQKVFIHAFMDGRDTPPASGLKYIGELEEKIKEIGCGQMASMSGRFYSMDRDKRWERIEKAYDVLTGTSSESGMSAIAIVNQSYQKNITDEFMIPHVVVDKKGKPVGSIQKGDAVIFFNFRADRAREITQALTQENFTGFTRKVFPELAAYVCMAPYDEAFNHPVAFELTWPRQVLAEVLSQKGFRQLHIAETEKYAHVTFFFNGGREAPFDGEGRVLIPSPREVPTYDLKPEMAAQAITDEVVKAVETDQYDFIIMNYANPDMVGHSAKEKPIISAIETVDQCLDRVVSAVLKKGGQLIITADHGNAEQIVDEKGIPHTAHTTNPVPFVVVADRFRVGAKNILPLRSGGRLCDVAPTLLYMMGLPKPAEMTGENLIVG